MGNKNLYMLNAEYNDYDDIEDYFEDYIPDEEEQSKPIVYVPYIPEYINIQDIGLGMEIPVNSIDISYSDKPMVRISDNELLNIKRPNIRTRNTIQKNPQERIDYINKKRTDINPINNIPQKSEEIVMKPKKKETKKIDYQKIADTLYPSMKEKSQIGVTQRYKLLDDTPPKNTKIFYNYEPMTLLGDSNYKAPNLFEKEKLQKENEILKKALEYEIKMKNRADILYPTMKDKKEALTGGAAPLLESKVEMNVKPPRHKLKNEIGVDHIDNVELRKFAKKNYGVEAAENLYMSKKDTYLNTEYAKEHLIFNNYTELESDLRNYFKKKITSQIGADKLKTTGGIYINAEHQSSKKLAKALVDNPDFIKEVAKNYKSMKLGNSVNTSVNFAYDNFHYAIGYADIRDMHINKRGELDLLVTDVYDFNENDPSDLVQVGRDRQLKGEIIPYFIIYHVIIPKNAKLGESKKK